jgi:hypothetical protein
MSNLYMDVVRAPGACSVGLERLACPTVREQRIYTAFASPFELGWTADKSAMRMVRPRERKWSLLRNAKSVEMIK